MTITLVGTITVNVNKAQTVFSDVPVARHRFMGTLYSKARMYTSHPEFVDVSTRTKKDHSKGMSYRRNPVESIEILRPDLVKIIVTPPKELRNNGLKSRGYVEYTKHNEAQQELESPKTTVGTTPTRRQCDMFMKAHVGVGVFLDYESFLTDMVEFIQNGGT